MWRHCSSSILQCPLESLEFAVWNISQRTLEMLIAAFVHSKTAPFGKVIAGHLWTVIAWQHHLRSTFNVHILFLLILAYCPMPEHQINPGIRENIMRPTIAKGSYSCSYCGWIPSCEWQPRGHRNDTQPRQIRRCDGVSSKEFFSWQETNDMVFPVPDLRVLLQTGKNL